MTTPFDVFLSPEALQLNYARHQHLAALGLDLAGKRVLEVGAGIGLHGEFFERLGCSIISTDARPENVAEIARVFPHRQAEVVDLDTAKDISYLGEFDIVYCYGTLYHLSQPEQALQVLSQVCKGMILLETCVTPGNELEIYPVGEDLNNPNQATSGLGCRPTRPWVMATLKKYFDFVYATKYQPAAPNFDLDWQHPLTQKLHRSVFIAARQAIANEKLLAELPPYQTYDPDTQRTWIDVGAHMGQTSLEPARFDPGLTVYAFEPNLRLAGQLFAMLPNYIVLPTAIAIQDGFSRFNVNQNDATSSLREFNPAGVKEWICGEQLQREIITPVPTIRLDSFLKEMKIERVDYLKVDAQGSDLEVVQSLGDRLKDVLKIRLEVAITALQPYANAHTKQDVIDYFQQYDFVLVTSEKQSFDQEENLTFVRRDQLPTLSQDLSSLVQNLVPKAVPLIAEAVEQSRLLQTYPVWRTGSDTDLISLEATARRSLWQQLSDQTFVDPIKFQWYRSLQLVLDLNSHVYRQLFVDRCFRPNEFCALEQLLHPSMTFVEVGALHDLYSVFAASCVGSAGCVLVWAAEPQVCDRLQTNLALNQLHAVKIHCFSEFNSSGNFNTLDNIESVDQLVSQFEIGRVDVIKLDDSSNALLILCSSASILHQFQPVLLVELTGQLPQSLAPDFTKACDRLVEIGYKLFTIGILTGLPVPLQDDNWHSSLIAIHPEGVQSELITQYTQHGAMELGRTYRELEWTRTELVQTQAALQQAASESEQKISQLTQQLELTQHELVQRQQDITNLKASIEQAAAQIERLQNTVQAMESSKFWQLRHKWMLVRQLLGLPVKE